MDGGIRSGQDILKAVALGARGTMIGRPFLYGLGAMGEQGVTKCLRDPAQRDGHHDGVLRPPRRAARDARHPAARHVPDLSERGAPDRALLTSIRVHRAGPREDLGARRARPAILSATTTPHDPTRPVALALAALLAAASARAQEPARGALCRAFEGKAGELTLVNLVPRRPAGGVVDLSDVDIDADGWPDPIKPPAVRDGGQHRACALTMTLAGGQGVKFEREHIALVQAGSRVYVSSAQSVCRTHKLASSAELAAVVKGRFVTRCGPIVTPAAAAAGPDC